MPDKGSKLTEKVASHVGVDWGHVGERDSSGERRGLGVFAGVWWEDETDADGCDGGRETDVRS